MVLNAERMKKRFLIITVVQGMLMVAMLMFAVLQKGEADKQRELAEANARQAQEQGIVAEHLRIQLQSEVDNLRAELARLKHE